MKTQFRLPLLILLLVLAFAYSPLKAADDMSGDKVTLSVDNIEGSWAYDVQNVDPQYSKGVLYITKENGEYTLNIQGADSLIPTEELNVNGNEVKFVVYVEGERVVITLNFEGDTFSGNGSSSGGPFTMSGTRMPKTE